MRRIHLSVACFFLALACISWGTTGHFSVGLIAERHLTPKAKNAIQDLLGTESLSGISSWADDVRGESDYKHTGPWHYINLPLGLSSVSFEQKVTTMSEDNVYKAVLHCERDLRSSTTSRKEKTEALKFLTHFIGDLHQPMHVSRAEDKGGNTIVVNYKGESSNLHAVWDSKLIEDQGLSYKEIADKFDTASAPQILHWQSDSLIQWLWESYTISSRLYKEVEDMKSPDLKKAYYKEHISTVDLRLEMAGIRLAGILNSIFDDSYHPPAKGDVVKEEVPKPVKIEEAGNHIGEYATVCAKVYGHKDLDGLTLVNLGAAFPNSPMTVVLKGAALATYKKLDGREICVTGKIIDYKGKPEIIVTDPKKLQLSADR